MRARLRFLGGPFDGKDEEVAVRDYFWVNTNAFDPPMMHLYVLSGPLEKPTGYLYSGLVRSEFSANR